MNKSEPTFQSRPAFKIAGVERYTSEGITNIRQAWDEFGKRWNDIPNAVEPEVAYGFEDYSRDFDMNKGGFPKYYYIAGKSVSSIDGLPDGLKGREVPAAEYAVFHYQGALDELPKFFGFIYGEWMPKSGYKMDPAVAADFERYTEKMTDPKNMSVNIWVPVVKS
jgi:AraC family transcriptional regulator